LAQKDKENASFFQKKIPNENSGFFNGSPRFSARQLHYAVSMAGFAIIFGVLDRTTLKF